MSGKSPTQEWLTIDEAAQQLDVSGATIRRYCHDGKLAKVHHGGRAYVVATSVDEYIRQKSAQAEATRLMVARARGGRK